MAEKAFTQRVYRAVGERIASARHGTGGGMTQGELASRAGEGLSRSAIANIERGRQRVAVHHLYLIAQALGVDPATLLPPAEQLFGGAARPPEDPELQAWLAKITRKTSAKEVKPGAKTKPD